MRVLAFDTSGPALSAAAGVLGSDSAAGLAAFRREALARGHAERLLPVLEEVLGEAGWRWRDLDRLAVTVGPGNFTGLRAGIAVARALGLALGLPALGLGTLEATAQAAGGGDVAAERRPILAVLDARRGQVYAQRFGPGLVPLEAPALVDRPAFVERAASCRVVGDPSAWAGTGWAGSAVTADARDLLALAARRGDRGGGAAAAPPAHRLRPLYLRAPDARPGAGASLLAAAVP